MLPRTVVGILMAALVVVALPGSPPGAAASAEDPVDVPVRVAGPVNLAGPGQVTVELYGTEDLDVRDLDPASLAFGAEGATALRADGDGAPALRGTDGAVLATVSDVNGNGREDLVVHVEKADLRAAGLGPATSALAVSGALPGDATAAGTAPVEPEVALEIKFDEALEVRGTDRTLRSQRGRTLEPVREVVARHGGGDLEPLVDAPAAARLDTLAVEAARASEEVPDLASWYRLTLSAGADVERALADLRALPEIEYAYPAPEPAPPPQATDTPDFTDLQGYLRPAPEGIDADLVLEDERLRGAGIKIVDLEYNWNPYHEDLQLDIEPEPDSANLALSADVECSYTSPWESCSVLNSGNDPGSSNPSSGRWGTWPETGSHWIQLSWDEPQEIALVDLYWFQDSADGSNSGVKRPAEWTLSYWDGDGFVEVANPSGYGTALDEYNRTTFDPVTTTALRADLETRDDAQGVGALQWKAYSEPPDDDENDIDHWTTDVGDGQFVRIETFGDDHGTAVFGQLVALENDYGVTGGVPDADMYGISPVQQFGSGATAWNPGPALAYLASRTDDDGEPWLQPGDAVLLEQQTSSPLGGSRYAPLEWIPSVFEAIEVLTAMGVNVVSTGGNGNTDTDDPMYTRDGIAWFDPEVQHSGSILVGAGGSGLSAQGAQERLGFSNYGTRFDLQAWGQDIVTTGYCSLYCVSGNHNIRYSQTFGGTSGAGPIVTAAVVAVQSYVKATGQEPWSAQEIADVLKATGVPQGPNTADEHIGPMPDLRAALVSIEVDPPTTTAALAPAPTNGWYHDPTVTLEADDGWGSGVDVTEYRLNGGDWVAYDGPFEVAEDGEHTLEYRSTDHNGNVEDVRTLEFGVDTTPPEITLTTPTDGAAYLVDEALDVDYACTDAVSGVVTCDGTLPAGDPLPTGTVGFHDFAVSATDAAGNATEASATYQVVWPFEGFLPPVEGPPERNVAEAGRAVPLRFGLGDDRGLDILADGAPWTLEISCDTGEVVDGEQTPTLSPSGLRYDDRDEHYVYVWRTPSAWSGTCLRLGLELRDGTVHTADFAFR